METATHDEHDEHGGTERQEQPVCHSRTHAPDKACRVARSDDEALQRRPTHEPPVSRRVNKLRSVRPSSRMGNLKVTHSCIKSSIHGTRRNGPVESE